MICDTISKITCHKKQLEFLITQLIQPQIILTVINMNDMRTTIGSTLILNRFNLEGVYGIIFLHHAILMERALTEEMKTKCSDKNLTNTIFVNVIFIFIL